jgi:hypothetical protein
MLRTESQIVLCREHQIFLSSVTENRNFKANFLKLHDINSDENNFTDFSSIFLRVDGQSKDGQADMMMLIG